MMESGIVKMKEVPKQDRPRERLIEYGPGNLSNQELMAILFGTGTRKENVYQLAERVLKHFEGIGMLREVTIEELIKVKGIGQAKGVVLLAAVELGKRIQHFQEKDRYVIRSPEDGANFLMEEMCALKQEHFVAIFLNTKKTKSSTDKLSSLEASMPRLFTPVKSTAKLLKDLQHP